jgi:hypothetical protein
MAVTVMNILARIGIEEAIFVDIPPGVRKQAMCSSVCTKGAKTTALAKWLKNNQDIGIAKSGWGNLSHALCRSVATTTSFTSHQERPFNELPDESRLEGHLHANGV